MNLVRLNVTDAMARAIAAGHKTQTRRPVRTDTFKLIPRRDLKSDIPFYPERFNAGERYNARLNWSGAVTALDGNNQLGMKPGEFDFVCRYMPGGETHLFADEWHITPRENIYNFVAVFCETWAVMKYHDRLPPSKLKPFHTVPWYRASYATPSVFKGKWRPARFMPYWVARSTRIITDVKLQRLHDITKEDAIAEGIISPTRGVYCGATPPGADQTPKMFRDPRAAFFDIWESIYTDHRLDSLNPTWVWVVTFGKHDISINAELERRRKHTK